ncbi:MAG: nucleotidyltransferase family protein [Planctomycetota bacterium]
MSSDTLQSRIPVDAIEGYCAKWKITEFALFGSVLRDDFGPDSDVDVLVTFHEDAKRSLFDLVHMADELEELFGRKVDLLTRRSIERSHNPYRKHLILSTAEVVYAA